MRAGPPDGIHLLQRLADILDAGAPVPADLVAQLRVWLRSLPGAPVPKPPAPPPGYRRGTL
jgi:hypothetical protein